MVYIINPPDLEHPDRMFPDTDGCDITDIDDSIAGTGATPGDDGLTYGDETAYRVKPEGYADSVATPTAVLTPVLQGDLPADLQTTQPIQEAPSASTASQKAESLSKLTGFTFSADEHNNITSRDTELTYAIAKRTGAILEDYIGPNITLSHETKPNALRSHPSNIAYDQGILSIPADAITEQAYSDLLEQKDDVEKRVATAKRFQPPAVLSEQSL